MKIYGLSDARTHRIIPFPRSPFLEYQWEGEGRAQLTAAWLIGFRSSLLDTRFVLKNELSFSCVLRDQSNCTNFFSFFFLANVSFDAK